MGGHGQYCRHVLTAVFSILVKIMSMSTGSHNVAVRWPRLLTDHASQRVIVVEPTSWRTPELQRQFVGAAIRVQPLGPSRVVSELVADETGGVVVWDWQQQPAIGLAWLMERTQRWKTVILLDASDQRFAPVLRELGAASIGSRSDGPTELAVVIRRLLDTIGR